MDTPRGLTRRDVFVLVSMLLLVFLIIVFVTGFGLDVFRGRVTEEAQISKAKADIKAWEVNLIRYRTRYHDLPTQAQGLEALVVKPTTGRIPDEWKQLAKPEALKDPWGHPYQYRSPGKRHPESYDLYSPGPDGIEDTLDDIGNW